MSNTSDIVIDPAGPTPDRMEQHHRQQLSAMADGALAPDQARFLLRRLQHDHELAARWERWQVYGDAMRGHAHALLPVDFAERVARALHEDVPQAAAAGAPMRRRGHALRWAGGGALAASVALAALLGLRPQAGGESLEAAAVAAQAEAPIPVEAAPSTQAPPAVEPAPASAQALAGAAVATAAIAAAPVAVSRARPAARSSGVPRAVAVAARSAPAVAEPPPVTAGQGAVPAQTSMAVQAATPTDPFAAPAPRPWPRAVLPGANQGAFNASFGGPVFAPYPALRTVPADATGAAPAAEPGQ